MNEPPEDYLAYKETEDGRFVGIIPITFGQTRIVIGKVSDPLFFDDVW